MAAVDFDMKFVFIMTGWEVSIIESHAQHPISVSLYHLAGITLLTLHIPIDVALFFPILNTINIWINAHHSNNQSATNLQRISSTTTMLS
jgi:hypothetical protein